jgi:hypothetical protein
MKEIQKEKRRKKRVVKMKGGKMKEMMKVKLFVII